MKKFIYLFAIISCLYAQEPTVNVEQIEEKIVFDTQKFIGNIKFNKLANVACEDDGIVQDIKFVDGEYVQKNQELIVLNSDIIDANIQALRANIQEANISLRQSLDDLQRYENLIKSESIMQKMYDDQKYLVAQNTQKLSSLKAKLNAMLIQKDKRIIKAPFSGIITNKYTQIGEWANSGKSLFTIVDTTDIGIEFNVPSNFLDNIKNGDECVVNIDNKSAKAIIYAIIPKGDTITRTFPIKLKLTTNMPVYEGMQATINLASTNQIKALTVNKNAVVKRFNQDVIFIDDNSMAKMVPVKVLSYQKGYTAIQAPNIKVGDMVITKGNERIMPNTLIKSVYMKLKQ